MAFAWRGSIQAALLGVDSRLLRPTSAQGLHLTANFTHGWLSPKKRFANRNLNSQPRKKVRCGPKRADSRKRELPVPQADPYTWNEA